MTSTKISLAENKKIAIVYDWLDSKGGAERIFPVFERMFPHADWYTSVVRNTSVQNNHVRSSFIQKLPFFSSHRKAALTLYPFAFESFDFTGYDIVISVTSSFAKGVITKPETRHICYMLTPSRFLWSAERDYINPLARWLVRPYLSYLKKWDIIASQRPDQIVSISRAISEKIHIYYKRASKTIYPPFDINYWESTLRNAQKPSYELPEGFFLLVSRLVPYKKVDLAIEAFKKLPNKHLIIVGKGPQKRALQAKAPSNVIFYEDISDVELAYLYGHAKGLIMPQEEDFGYTSLEAQLCSCPVIAYNKGGATETVQHEKTGYLFDDQSPKGICDAIENFEQISYTIDHYIQAHGSEVVSQFAEDVFVKSFTNYIQNNT